MYDLYDFIERIIEFQIAFDIFNALIGVSLCFGALKWRKGLIASTAFYWGLLLGLLIGMILMFSTDSEASLVLSLIIGGVIFPILAFTVAGVNRFVVGYIVAYKLSFMVTTVFLKAYQMDIEAAIIAPIAVGIILGLFFMGWVQVPVGAFVTACAFVGASQVAQVAARYINQAGYAITGSSFFFFDPYDIMFGLFGIELTDATTLIVLLVLMPIGIIYHINYIKRQGYTLQTPVITFETEKYEDHGKIFPEKSSL